MGSRKTDIYVDDAKLVLRELITYLKTVDSATIKDLAKELDRDRNFISAFVYACVALDICDVEITNQNKISLKSELKEKLDFSTYKFDLVPIKKSEDSG